MNSNKTVNAQGWGYGGWNDNEGKSNRALDAEDQGMLNITSLGKILRVDSETIRSHLAPSEWHHTGGYFQETDYYDEPLLLACAVEDAVILREYSAEDVAEARNLLSRMRAETKEVRRDYRLLRKKRVPERKQVKQVKWLEWSGSRRHPKCTERSAENVEVTIKGTKCIIHLPEGDLVKMTTGNGFELTES